MLEPYMEKLSVSVRFGKGRGKVVIIAEELINTPIKPLPPIDTTICRSTKAEVINGYAMYRLDKELKIRLRISCVDLGMDPQLRLF